MKVRRLEVIWGQSDDAAVTFLLSFLIDVGSFFPFVRKEDDNGRESTFLSFLIDVGQFLSFCAKGR